MNTSDLNILLSTNVEGIRSYLIGHPTVFSFAIIAVISLMILIVFVIIPMRMARKKISRKHSQQREHWKKLRQMVQYETQTYTWHLNKGLVQFQKEFAKSHKLPELASARKLELRIHPSYRQQWEDMLKSFDEGGMHKVRLLINTQMSPSATTEEWHYFDIIYDVTSEMHEHKTMWGVVRDADTEENDSKKLKACYEEIGRTEIKEKQLMAISPQLFGDLQEIIDMAETFIDEDKKSSASFEYKIDKLQKTLNEVM